MYYFDKFNLKLYFYDAVALSRVKSIDGLSLSHNLKHCYIQAHPDVKEFYSSLMRSERDEDDIISSQKGGWGVSKIR